jgi:hypothetical protein
MVIATSPNQRFTENPMATLNRDQPSLLTITDDDDESRDKGHGDRCS